MDVPRCVSVWPPICWEHLRVASSTQECLCGLPSSWCGRGQHTQVSVQEPCGNKHGRKA